MRIERIAALAIALVTLGAGAAEAQDIKGFGRGARRPTNDNKTYVPAAKAAEKIFPLDSTWTAVSLNGKSFGGTERPSFSIDKQYRARGFGGCNTFAATAFPLREQSLAVGPLALTKKSCDKDLQVTEQSFLVALRTAGKWDFVGSQLIIKSQNGELRLDRAL